MFLPIVRRIRESRVGFFDVSGSSVPKEAAGSGDLGNEAKLCPLSAAPLFVSGFFVRRVKGTEHGGDGGPNNKNKTRLVKLPSTFSSSDDDEEDTWIGSNFISLLWCPWECHIDFWDDLSCL